nr:hypothetical protein Iba_chr15aCG15300 [Ipomoea batatas]
MREGRQSVKKSDIVFESWVACFVVGTPKVFCGLVLEYGPKCYGIYHQLRDGEWEVIFRASNIKVPKVHTYTDLAVLLAHRHNARYPSWIFHFADEPASMSLLTSPSIEEKSSG